MTRIPLAAALFLVSSLLSAQDFYEARLRSGEAELSASRPAEAVDDLRIAAFGFLDRPASLCEALGHLALAHEGAGQKSETDAALRRLAEVAGAFPACRQARFEPEKRRQLEHLARARLPGVSADAITAAPTAGASTPPANAVAAVRAAPVATPVPQTRRAAASVAPPTATAVRPPPVRATPVEPAAPPARRISESPAPESATVSQDRSRAVSPAPQPPAPREAASSSGGSGSAVPSEDLDRQPQLKKTTRPTYPRAARERRVGGVVLLRVLVSERGEPLRVEIARGIQPDLDQAALEAVRLWQFEPGKKGSVPVASWTTVAVPFDPSR